MTTICLNMIVKNEAHCIARCLASARKLIDYYVIVDTGSSDDTKKVIQEALEGIPGEIIDRPWVDFGHNRTEALHLALGKADYLMVVDADDEIVGEKPTNLTHDCYTLAVHLPGGLVHARPHIFRADSRFYYAGILHECLEFNPHQEEKLDVALLPTLKYLCHGGGARSGDGTAEAFRLKCLRDARTLERALEEDPENKRYVYYLAQSWRDAGEAEDAIAWYTRRVTMSENGDVERWYSLLQIAMLRLKLKRPEGEIIDSFLRAFEDRPGRIEPMYELGMYLQDKDRHFLCYYLLNPLLAVPLSKDSLFLDNDAWLWGLKDLVAVSAYHVGDMQTARILSEELLTSPHLPASERERVAANLQGIRNNPTNLFTWTR